MLSPDELVAIESLTDLSLISSLGSLRYPTRTTYDGGRLGYACINTDLRKSKIFCGRNVTKKTIEKLGPSVIGERALQNCRDLLTILEWNERHGIRFMRISSDMWPWMSEYDMTTDPKWPDICRALRCAGEYARSRGHRLTFHPSHFVKLGSPDETLAKKSIRELEMHSLILDTMGFDTASVQNKINIHVGGMYGDKSSTMRRWSDRYMSLTPRCRARVTVENDDVKTAYSVRDLLELHGMCGVPIVFDFHHHRFCPGGMTEEEALQAAISTWPREITPVVHWSESQADRKPSAHSDYVQGPIWTHGLAVDVMIEAKMKEDALLTLYM
jgi:UV DNA damage endonuclease